jgi:hypothetical protein
VIVRARREEEKAQNIEAKTRRLVDDQLAWQEATVGVMPLLRK